MSFDFRPARRENVPLLIGVAGGTGSGKTMSALRIARGIAAGHPFAAIDTENGRMNHYADLFPELRIAQIGAPFRPVKYADAIEAAVNYLDGEGVPVANRVVVVDSMSHEWAGDGGCLDWHDELMGGDQKKNLAAWIEPKKAHKRMVTRLLQVHAHVVLAFRAEPKVEAVREGGQTKIIAKPSVTGLDGWIPISEKMLPYELTASFLLMADKPGVPRPIKLQEQHRPMVPLAEPLGEEVGKALAAWASGASGNGRVAAASAPVPVPSSPQPEPEPDPAPDDVASVEPITAAQKKKLNVLVGKLRDAGHITTEQLYRRCQVEPVPGEDGELHWSTLRDSLSKTWASGLIEALSRLEERVAGEGSYDFVGRAAEVQARRAGS